MYLSTFMTILCHQDNVSGTQTSETQASVTTDHHDAFDKSQDSDRFVFEVNKMPLLIIE